MNQPKTLVVAALAAALFLGALALRLSMRPGSGPAEAYAFGQGGLRDPLWRVPAFRALDQDGKEMTDRDLRGRPWIASFLFTTCTTACPLISSRLALLQRKLTDPTLRFVSFTVDPEQDTPALLRAYRARWSADPRWTLLNAAAGTAALVAGMKVTAEREPGPQGTIVHSTILELVDGAGEVRAIYDSADPEAMERLVRDARSLGASAASPPAGAIDGPHLYARLGCAGCHEGARIGPELGGLLGRAVVLQGGARLVADRDYIRESIVAPAAKIAAGYPNSMPSYAGHLSQSELEALVAHVAALPAPAAAPSPRTTAVDPVCGMEVVVGPGTPHAAAGGAEHWFCSESCKREFVARPDRAGLPRAHPAR